MIDQTPTLPSLRTHSLRDQAVAAVREAIIMGRIAPGTHLAETKLAGDLGISRSTLREALPRLQLEGLAVHDGRGRLFVRSLDEQTIRDTFVVRAAIEGLAARLVAELPPNEKDLAIAELETALEELGRAETGPAHANVEADLEFHRTLCRVSGNGPLLHAWEQMAAVISMSIMKAGVDKARHNMSAERHRVIIEVVESGDPQAERRLLDHFLSVPDDFFPPDN